MLRFLLLSLFFAITAGCGKEVGPPTPRLGFVFYGTVTTTRAAKPVAGEASILRVRSDGSTATYLYTRLQPDGRYRLRVEGGTGDDADGYWRLRIEPDSDRLRLAEILIQADTFSTPVGDSVRFDFQLGEVDEWPMDAKAHLMISQPDRNTEGS